MSWFDTVGIASFAKSALTTAQKTIDKALDIQEESSSKSEKKSSVNKADAENFFEAFGLSEKPSTSQPIPKSKSLSKVKPSQNVSPTNSNVLQQSEGQGSRFWSDTWGSFFEMKGQEESSSQLKSKTDLVENESNPRIANTVLSQPQKASLFPSDSHSPQNSEEIKKDANDSNEVFSSLKDLPKREITSSQLHFYDDSDSTPCLIEVEDSKKTVPTEIIATNVISLPKIPEDSLKEPSISVVTEQPCSESTLNITDLPDLLSQSPYTMKGSQISKDENAISACDISIVENIQEQESSNVSSSPEVINVPPEKFISDAASCKTMEESVFFTLHLPKPSENTNQKVESEYDVIDLVPDEVLSDRDTKSEEFFIESSPEENTDSMYDASGSTLVIPDLPVTMPENIANWECCALDTLSPDLFTAEENENIDCRNDNVRITSKSTLQLSSSESFHTISADSFNNNRTWNQSNKSIHFIDESQNSSNGERNSHHSDGSSNSSKDDDDTDTAEVKEFDAKSSSSSGSHTTSSSFVKCSVDDTNSTRGHSPTSTIASEKSDATKQESTSGDENETATSSDIEILSPPNGENGERNTSPLKHVWLPRPLRFRRSESPTSDSSKDSMMPVVNELDEVCYADNLSSTVALYGDKDQRFDCHKDYGESGNLCQLLQKQDELQTLLDAREKKLVDLSKENVELQENEQRLKNLMQKMRIERDKESKDITSLTREFTQRLSLVESQLKEAVQERDFLKAELEDIKLELAKRISAADMEEVIKEKDIQIKELTEEGQKLSKKELLHTTIIRKLRAKEEEMTKTLKVQTEELLDNTKEVERLRKSIGAKEDQEKKHIDAIRDLSNSVKRLEKEVSLLKSDLEDSREKELSLKKSLDGTYKDLTDLRKSYASKEIEVQELKSSLELQAKENLQQTLENARREAAREKESLLFQMQDLRNSLSRSEEEANMREKMFKSEIAGLQKRLQEAEERNEDLTKNMSSATRPLVRQIENLQATFTTQTISWEKIEKNLTDRLGDAQNQVAFLTEKERAAGEKYLECQSRLTALETQNSSLRQDKLQLSSELETLRTNIVMLEDSKNRENYTLEKVKQNFNAEIKKLKHEKVNLETTMATCLEQLDVEKRKTAKLEEEIKIKDARAMILSNVSPCPSPTGSVRSSVSSIHNWSQDESHDPGLHTPVNSYRMSVYESLRLGSGSSLLENLQSQLKQREGEIYQLQTEISKLEQVKESMTRELVQLSEQNEELDKKLAKLESLEKEHRDLDQKYNTLLQMYGEKVEETEELQLDLSDVKSMYKAQIEELLMNK